ncbi:MAG TPA: hypothetical protein PLA50_16505, partial [Bacteroidia bacterium]|nr:hypothetical protein [Bacteroidia bacterium]
MFIGQFGWCLGPTIPDDWLALNGSVIPVSEYAELVDFLYCGDGNNATAGWHFRSSTQASPGSNRSTSGAYFVLGD